MTTPAPLNRQHSVQRGRKLEHFTIAWNSLEALASLIAGLIAGSPEQAARPLNSIGESSKKRCSWLFGDRLLPHAPPHHINRKPTLSG